MGTIIESQPHAYIIHEESGLPVRMPSYVRREIRSQTSGGSLIVDLIAKNPFIGNRTEEDALLRNRDENSRHLKIGVAISRQLAEIAKSEGIKRYCTILHGSVSLGLSRSKDNPDPSDIDVDLVIEDDTLPISKRMQVRNDMYRMSGKYGQKIDSNIWTLNEIKRNSSQFARLYLSSAAIPHIDVGALWSDILSIGIENERFHTLSASMKKRIKNMLLKIITSDTTSLEDMLSESEPSSSQTKAYADEIGLFDSDNQKGTALRMYNLLFMSNEFQPKKSHCKTNARNIPEQTIYPYRLGPLYEDD